MESNDSSNQNQSPRIRKEPSSTRWRGDSHLPSPHESDSAFSSDNDLVIFDLPLLRSDSGVLESESPRSIEFRQRNLQNSVKGYMAIDMESGAGSKCSESVDKLDNLGNESSFSVGLVVKTVVLVIVWYTFSTLLTLYNKTLLGDDLGKFPLPLMMNTVHFGMQAVLSNSIVWVQSRFCRANVGPTMTWRDYFIKVVPTALGTALDINLSNASLVFISVSFATMCKSASPIFLLLFAFAFRLESPSFKLLGIILVISVGILFTVAREAQFEFWGFFFVMLAAVMSGFRWCMTQILLQKETYGLKNPITLMSYVTPVMTLVTALFSLMFDHWHNLSKNKYFDDSTHIIHSFLLMLLGGSLAFFMVLTEYMLVSATSAVTVTIAGIIKEAVTIVVAVFYFHDQFTFLKGIGLLVIIVGVGLFNWYKYTKLNKGSANQSGEMNSTFNNAAKYVILDEDFPEGEI